MLSMQNVCLGKSGEINERSRTCCLCALAFQNLHLSFVLPYISPPTFCFQWSNQPVYLFRFPIILKQDCHSWIDQIFSHMLMKPGSLQACWLWVMGEIADANIIIFAHILLSLPTKMSESPFIFTLHLRSRRFISTWNKWTQAKTTPTWTTLTLP